MRISSDPAMQERGFPNRQESQFLWDRSDLDSLNNNAVVNGSECPGIGEKRSFHLFLRLLGALFFWITLYHPGLVLAQEISVIPQSQLSMMSTNSHTPEDGTIFDGSTHTQWLHSGNWPAEVVISLGGKYQVAGLGYDDFRGWTRIEDFAIYVSDDSEVWGEAVFTGSIPDRGRTLVTFPPAQGKFMKLVVFTTSTDNRYFYTAELNVYTVLDPISTDGKPEKVNRPPVASTDTVLSDSGGTISVSVLNNDFDPDGDSLEISGVSQGSNGTVNYSQKMVFYSPETDFQGSDRFQYFVSDGKGGMGSGIVIVNVLAGESQETLQKIPQSQLSVVSPSKSLLELAKLFDGNMATGLIQLMDRPWEIIFDLGSKRWVAGISYDFYRTLIGNMNYRVHVSSDTVLWGNAVSTGSIEREGQTLITFPPQQGQYVKLIIFSADIGNSLVTTAELNVYEAIVHAPKQDSLPPVLSNGSPRSILAAGITEATLSVSTNEPTDCRFNAEDPMSFHAMVDTFSTNDGRYHQALVAGLMNGRHYDFFIACRDRAGNVNSDIFPVSFDVADSRDVLRVRHPAKALTPSGYNVSDIYYAIREPWNRSGDRIQLYLQPPGEGGRLVWAKIDELKTWETEAEFLTRIHRIPSGSDNSGFDIFMEWSIFPGEETILYGAYHPTREIASYDVDTGIITPITSFDYADARMIDPYIKGWTKDGRLIMNLNNEVWRDGALEIDVHTGHKVFHPYAKKDISGGTEAWRWPSTGHGHGAINPDWSMKADYHHDRIETVLGGTIIRNRIRSRSEFSPKSSLTHVSWRASNEWWIADDVGLAFYAGAFSPGGFPVEPHIETYRIFQCWIDGSCAILYEPQSAGAYFKDIDLRENGEKEYNYQASPIPVVKRDGTQILFTATGPNYSREDFINYGKTPWSYPRLWLLELERTIQETLPF